MLHHLFRIVVVTSVLHALVGCFAALLQPPGRFPLETATRFPTVEVTR